MDQTDITPGAGNSLTIRLKLENRPGRLAEATASIGKAGGNIGAIDIVGVSNGVLERDITVHTRSDEHGRTIVDGLNALDGIEVVNVSDRTFLLHLGGKIEVNSKVPVDTRDRLSMAYTPGVARVCEAIHRDSEDAFSLTIKGNTVAVVTDGTAVLGLGDIGPKAALPVMEGKAQLFKEFAGLNAFPVCLNTTDVDEIVDTVKRIAPVFGGINLEDISAPRCFEIEKRLEEELDIPVFHDDQHGTAVVTVGALLNALKVVGKQAADIKVVLVGIGAAGTAVTHMLRDIGVEHIVGVDRKGAVARTRTDLTPAKASYARLTNPENEEGSLDDVIRGADVFIGLSAPGVLSVDAVKTMASDPIVFAMANPEPEIRPERAYPHVAIMATGRSDYPNQINNVLCFPGLFKGALKARTTAITDEMKMAAAQAIARTIDANSRTAEYIVPSVFDQRVVEEVSTAVQEAAIACGAARRQQV